MGKWGEVRVPRCYWCGDVTDKKAKRYGLFCSDFCAIQTALDQLIGQKVAWCRKCKKWLWLRGDLCCVGDNWDRRYQRIPEPIKPTT